MAKKPDEKKEPEVHVDFLGVLKPEGEAWLVRPSPYIQDDIPEYIFKAIEAHFQDPKLPAPDLLEQLIAWETADKLLPPIEITSLKRKVEKRFPGLIKETIKRRAGQGEGKGKEKEEVKTRLKLVSKTQETYWDGQRKKVTETEFYALWLLATVPNSTVQRTILYKLFKDSKGNADVYISRLIRGRGERKSGLKYHFLEIEQLIESQEKVGYYLKLAPEEIELVGDDPEDIEHLVVRLTST